MEYHGPLHVNSADCTSSLQRGRVACYLDSVVSILTLFLSNLTDDDDTDTDTDNESDSDDSDDSDSDDSDSDSD